MSYFTVCAVNCSICGKSFDFMRKYGRDASCCSKECWDEFYWRWVLAVMGKPYKERTKALEEVTKNG